MGLFTPMVTEAPTVLSEPSWRPWRATDDDDFSACGATAGRADLLELAPDPREPILANFRVLARTNSILRAVAAQAASGD